jgi:hypothetical protein
MYKVAAEGFRPAEGMRSFVKRWWFWVVIIILAALVVVHTYLAI